jgi:hypothetical protein
MADENEVRQVQIVSANEKEIQNKLNFLKVKICDVPELKKINSEEKFKI